MNGLILVGAGALMLGLRFWFENLQAVTMLRFAIYVRLCGKRGGSCVLRHARCGWLAAAACCRLMMRERGTSKVWSDTLVPFPETGKRNFRPQALLYWPFGRIGGFGTGRKFGSPVSENCDTGR